MGYSVSPITHPRGKTFFFSGVGTASRRIHWLDLYWRRIIRLDELGKRSVARLIIRLCINTGKQTDLPSTRAIAIVRLMRWTIVENSSRRMIRLVARIYTQMDYHTSYRSLPKLVPDGWYIRLLYKSGHYGASGGLARTSRDIWMF